MKNSDRLAFNRAAENELSRRRAATLRIANARRENVRNNYPEIEAIRREMLEIGFDLGDKLMREPASEYKQIYIQHLIDVKYTDPEVMRHFIQHGHCQRVVSFTGMKKRRPVRIHA